MRKFSHNLSMQSLSKLNHEKSVDCTKISDLFKKIVLKKSCCYQKEILLLSNKNFGPIKINLTLIKKILQLSNKSLLLSKQKQKKQKNKKKYFAFIKIENITPIKQILALMKKIICFYQNRKYYSCKKNSWFYQKQKEILPLSKKICSYQKNFFAPIKKFYPYQ